MTKFILDRVLYYIVKDSFLLFPHINNSSVNCSMSTTIIQKLVTR